MGQKVNPKAFRIGINVSWLSKWYAGNDYADLLREDILIRKFLMTKIKDAGIDKIEIERTPRELVVNITAARPGIIIGRGGEGVEALRSEIGKKFVKTLKQNIKMNIKEVKNPNLSAAVMLHFMITDVEKRMPFRRVMKQSIDRVMKAGAQGVKICMAGRLNGVEIARTETLSEGKIPLHTLRANIDYSRGVARTTYGAIGIKVWIYKGEVFEKEENDNNNNQKKKY
ncbi:30S ribosomal protein S3 [bacterium]|jgi:small subunit ribosomal protein S3|nr:30S ribosomal protein S3 [bacterium]MBT4335101.1 30S ribosomal protein S3 [bacterium]MBT4495264.1 30S ribosomal protein S3 [bacterium]MBT4763888.1 30S ribosomal protein S3 [bacterium]MBT5401259.1 30S ribosomal protein S3 [bacterium]